MKYELTKVSDTLQVLSVSIGPCKNTDLYSFRIDTPAFHYLTPLEQLVADANRGAELRDRVEQLRDSNEIVCAVAYDPMPVVYDECAGCGKPLLVMNHNVADGCPCNSPRGINHGKVPVSTCACDECEATQGQPKPQTWRDREPML